MYKAQNIYKKKHKKIIKMIYKQQKHYKMVLELNHIHNIHIY